MDMTGEHWINAPRQAVWLALNDPEVLKQSIAGCEALAKTSDTEFQAQVTAKVGPVKAKFSGKVTLSELDPPNGYTITGEGSGGAAGFAKGGAKVRLEDAENSGTLLGHSQITVPFKGALRRCEHNREEMVVQTVDTAILADAETAYEIRSDLRKGLFL